MLTNKQKCFIEFYTQIGEKTFNNATQSAIKAGYSPKTANRIASKLMAKVDIKGEIDRRLKAIADACNISRSDFIQKTLTLFEKEEKASVKLEYWKLLGELSGHVKPKQNVNVQQTYHITQEELDNIRDRLVIEEDNEENSGDLPDKI